MIQFRILGPVELRSADGSEIRSVISQPKRLALLAYLAENAGVFHRRDTLLALFWPELDHHRGRGALRQAIYHLRRALGAEVIVARGDDELGVDPDRLWCDAAAFRQAYKERRFRDAVELHRGELLVGLHVDQALELERWIDEERTRLQLAAVQAAWAVVEEEEEEGNTAAAVSWARRAVELGPDDEESARRLISLLARTGDLAGALRVYQDLAQHLERLYEVAPSATTQALIAEIRAAAPAVELPGRAERPPSPIPPGDDAFAADDGATLEPNGGRPATIAVLPFTFSGKPELEYLGEGMADLLGLAICGTDRFNCLDPKLLLTWFVREVKGRGGERLPDAELCRAVGERFNVEYCVIGGIVQSGDRLRAHSSLYDLRSPAEPLLRVSTEAGSDQLFELTDRLAAQLLTRSIGTPGTELSRIAALTTDSLPALKSYLNGERAFRAGRFTPAVEALQQAVNLDPSFALAHYRMAELAEWAGLIPLAQEAAARALANADRLPVNVRRLLEAVHAYLAGDISRAEALCREIIAIYPDSTEAWAQLAKLAYFLGSLRGRRFVEAAGPLERARELDPDNIVTLVHLANVAVKEGRLDEMKRLLDRVLELQRQGDYTDYPLILRVLREFALEDREAQAALWNELESANEVTLFWSYIILTLLVGNLSAARRVAELMTRTTNPPAVQLYGRLMLAELELAHGRWSGARVELDAAAYLDPGIATIYRAFFALLEFNETTPDELARLRDELDSMPPIAIDPDPGLSPWFTLPPDLVSAARLYLLGLIHLRSADWRAAEACASDLEAITGDFALVAFARDAAHGIRARLALARDDDPRTALAHLERSQLAAPVHIYLPSPLFGRLHERFLRAELLARTGRGDEAEQWYAALGEDSPHGSLYLAISHLRRAERLGASGDPSPARAHHEKFIDLWEGCDSPWRPLLEAAKEKLAETTPSPDPEVPATPVGTRRATSPATSSVRGEADQSPHRKGWPIAHISVLVIILATSLLAGVALLGRREPRAPTRIVVGTIEDPTGSVEPGANAALAGMLATNLARLPGIEVVSEIRIQQLLAQLGAETPERSGLDIVRAARAAGAGQVIDGMLYRQAAGEYRLELKSVDLETGLVEAAITVQGRDLFALVDAAAATFASEYGVDPPSVGFGEVTTHSLIAYRFYQEGLARYYAGDHARAGHLFNAAVDEDSTFALAMYYSALTTPFPKSAELMAEAVRLAARASDRERLMIEAAWAAATDDPRRLAIAETLAVRYPAEPAGHLFLGQARLWSGDFLGAIPYLRSVITMDSIGLRNAGTGCAACDAFWDLGTAYGMVDSLGVAQRVAREWIERQPQSATPWIALAFALDAEGRYDEALAAVDSATARQPGNRYIDVRSSILIRAAAFDELEEMFRELLRSGGQETRATALWSLALAQRTQGRPREALNTVQQLYGLAAHRSEVPADLAFYQAAEAQALLEAGFAQEAAALFEGAADVEIVDHSRARNARHRAWLLTHAATAYAELGNTARLTALADSVEYLGGLSAYGRDQRLHHHIRGLLHRMEGRHAAAVDEFRKAVFSPSGSFTRTNYELARSLLEIGRADEAITVLEEALRGPVGSSGYYLTRTEIQELLATALIAAGRDADAVPHLRWVVAAWDDGEPPFRERAEAARRWLARGPIAASDRQHGYYPALLAGRD